MRKTKIIHSRIKKIRLLALDVDGVLTNGKIIYDSSGNDIKVFDVKDGYGLLVWKKAGFKIAIITAKASRTVQRRASDIKIDKLYLNAYPKINAFEQLLKDFRITSGEVCYIGDDIPDIPILKKVGFAVAVSDASFEVRQIADFVTKKPGGSGAVREVVEVILRAKKIWTKIVSSET